MGHPRILAAPIAFNEADRIGSVLERFKGVDVVDEVIVLDDCSEDGLRNIVEEKGFRLLSQEKRSGVGAGIRRVIEYARENHYDILVILAGNDKDRPNEIPRLVEPIVREGYDFVQGSRYLPGGEFGKMPLYRWVATRYIHPILFSIIAGRRITDSTNGFRAFRLSMFENPELDINQSWLDGYELEPYLFYKAIKLGYKVKEVPATKIYPSKSLRYTKMKPVTGWWSILSPIIYLGLRIRK